MGPDEIKAFAEKLDCLNKSGKRIVFAITDGCVAIDEIAVCVGSTPASTKNRLKRLYEEVGLKTLTQLTIMLYWKKIIEDPDNERPSQPGKPISKILSTQELKIATLIAEGYSNENIVTFCQTSTMALKVSIKRIFDKLGLSHRSEVAMRVIREQFFTPQQQPSPASQ